MSQDSKPQEADQTEVVGGDGEDGELDVEFLEDDDPRPLCTWSNDPDEHRRAFVVRLMVDATISGVILVENMDMVCKWLKDGSMPTPTGKSRKLQSTGQ